MISALLQQITITLCCLKDYSLNHTDSCLQKKRDWDNRSLYLFAKTRYVYAVWYEACCRTDPATPGLLINFIQYFGLGNIFFSFCYTPSKYAVREIRP